MVDNSYKIQSRDVSVFYGKKQALFNVNLDIEKNSVTSLIGPSGCGKSTWLRCVNRMNDTIPICNVTGEILIDGINIKEFDVVELRAKIGMVFQKPNPFPKSIYDNILYGPKIHGIIDSKTNKDDYVEECLTAAGIFDEVKDRLKEPATGLSGGQQQRLCIARAIANKPDILLMDEPCSALDPIATMKIETLIRDLAENFTIIIVTHSMSQAQRISDKTAFFYLGELIESNKTKKIFNNPQDSKTKQYITGAFG